MKEGFEGICVSSKLYIAMAAGEPVLTIGQPDNDESRIVDTFDARIHVSQGDTSGNVEAIETCQADPELADQQGTNARRAFEDNFTTDASINEYYRMLVGTMSPQSPDA